MAANIDNAQAELIDQLLDDWEAAQERGEAPTVDELCKDHPTLKAVLQQRIRALSAFEQARVPADVAGSSGAEVTTALPAGTVVRQPNQPAPPGGPLAPPVLDFLSPPQRPDELGRLQRYRILRVLGQGGMGLVLEAEDERLGRRVALKVMRRDVAENVAHRERFLREARGAARVECDFIVPIYEVGEENGLPYLTMPLLKGRPLDEMLRQANRLPLAQTIQFAREIATGLAAAHEAGLVHRDIKPGNIWIETRPGQNARARILDFGLVRTESDTGTITQTGTILGTPAYMAPEQARGDELDFRADLFSFGVMLYEMTLGHRPFSGSNTMAILSSLATHEPPAPAELDPAVPERLSQLIQALLQKEAALRPPRTADIVASLVVLERQSLAQELNPAGTKISDRPSAPQTQIRAAIEVKPAEPRTQVVPSPLPQAKQHRLTIIGTVVALAGLLAAIVVWSQMPASDNSAQQPLASPVVVTSPKVDTKVDTQVSRPPQDTWEFDKDTRVELPAFDLDPAQPLTIEGWGTFHQPPADAKDPIIVALDFIRLRIAADHKWLISFNTPNSEAKTRLLWSDQPLSFDRRTHFAVVWTGERLTIYIDGLRQQSQPTIAAGHSPQPYYTLGSTPAGPGFAGKLHAVRISSSVRYVGPSISPADQWMTDDDTLALYGFQPDGDRLRDESGKNRHGKIQGARWLTDHRAPPAASFRSKPLRRGPIKFSGPRTWESTLKQPTK